MDKNQEIQNIKRRINEIELTIETLMQKETEYTGETLKELKQELLELNEKLNSLTNQEENDISFNQR